MSAKLPLHRVGRVTCADVATRDVWAANNVARTLDLHDGATIAGRCCLIAVGYWAGRSGWASDDPKLADDRRTGLRFRRLCAIAAGVVAGVLQRKSANRSRGTT